MAEFTEFEEDQIVLLAIESPDFFYRIAKFMKPDYFDVEVNQYIMSTYLEYYEEYDATPTKEVLKNIMYKELNQDDDLASPVMAVIDAELDFRNSKYIRKNVISWAKTKQLSMLYHEDVMTQIKEGNSDSVEQILEDAAAISEVVIIPFKFFEDVDELFIEDSRDYFTSGFSRVNEMIHDGNGPARREVFTWVAPTGVGKSIMLVNTSVMNVLEGKNVLHISLENSEKITGHRYLGAFTEIPIAARKKKQVAMKDKLRKIKIDSEGELYIIYFPTDTVSVREIDVALKDLKRQQGFVPDVLVIDYLECLISKNPYKNREEYTRQKAVSAEMRALAATTNTVLFTASQTNRSGSKAADEDKNINLDQLAESFGKAMPMDYVCSINQSQQDYSDG